MPVALARCYLIRLQRLTTGDDELQSVPRMTNLEIERALAEAADCDRRTARRALEHGYLTVRQGPVRDRIAAAIAKRPELASQYSKEHYP